MKPCNAVGACCTRRKVQTRTLSAVSCPECPPGEDSSSSMPACMSEDELLGDVLPATPVVPNVLYTICEQDGNLQDEPSGDVLDGP